MATFFQGQNFRSPGALPGMESEFNNLLAAANRIQTTNLSNQGAMKRQLAAEAGDVGQVLLKDKLESSRGQQELDFLKNLNPEFAQLIGDSQGNISPTTLRTIISSGDLSPEKKGVNQRLNLQTAGSLAGANPGNVRLNALFSEAINQAGGGGVAPLPMKSQPLDVTVKPFPGLRPDEQFGPGGSPFQLGLDAREPSVPTQGFVDPTLNAVQRDKAEKSALETQKLGREEGLETTRGTGQYDKTGNSLTGSFGEAFVVDKGTEGSRFVTATPQINSARLEFDQLSQADRAGQIKDYQANVKDTQEMAQVYDNLRLAFDTMKAQGRKMNSGDVSGIINRVKTAIQNDANVLPNFLQGGDSIAGLFRDDPIAAEIAKQWARIEAKALDLARNNNGGRPSDKDFEKVAGNFASVFDSPETIDSFGKGIVGLFGGPALDGAIISRNAGNFNALAPIVEGFIGEEYKFKRPLGNSPARIQSVRSSLGLDLQVPQSQLRQAPQAPKIDDIINSGGFTIR